MQKFGQKLSEISFIGGHKKDHIIKYNKLLSLRPNLITFGKRLSTHLSPFVNSNELLIPKLSTIEAIFHSIDTQTGQICVFIQCNKNCKFNLRLKFDK
jgi:hypothetical protein